MEKLKHWQAESIVKQYREPTDALAVLVVATCVLAALAIIGLGMASAAGVSW